MWEDDRPTPELEGAADAAAKPADGMGAKAPEDGGPAQAAERLADAQAGAWDSAAAEDLMLARELRRQALETDRVFLKIAHDVGRGGQGFVLSCRVHNIEPLGRSARWTTGYGEHTDAQVANLCALRYGQLPDGPSKAAYRRLILACAGRYLDSSPDRQKPIYPGAVGDAILHLADAHAIAGDTRYLERADALGRLAASLFFDGASPLPKASTLHSHYEAITRADTLMMAFLELWQKTHRSGQSVRLVYSDR